MDAAELARWTRFAGKGGIGKGTAVQDCVAKNPEDLMFLKVCSIYFNSCGYASLVNWDCVRSLYNACAFVHITERFGPGEQTY